MSSEDAGPETPAFDYCALRDSTPYDWPCQTGALVLGVLCRTAAEAVPVVAKHRVEVEALTRALEQRGGFVAPARLASGGPNRRGGGIILTMTGRQLSPPPN